MKSIPLYLLEGLVHNLRTPLNVIIGYSQKVADDHGAKHIYDSGIKMDDQLQQILESLDTICEEIKAQSLNAWLEAELCLLKNILAIKRQFLIEPPDYQRDYRAVFSGTQLSRFTEDVLLEIARIMPNTSLKLSFQLGTDPDYQIILAIPQVPDNLNAEVMGICAAYSVHSQFQAKARFDNQILTIEVTLK